MAGVSAATNQSDTTAASSPVTAQHGDGEEKVQPEGAGGDAGEPLGGVTQPAGQERQSEHERDVGQDRADDRGLDDGGSPARRAKTEISSPWAREAALRHPLRSAEERSFNFLRLDA